MLSTRMWREILLCWGVIIFVGVIIMREIRVVWVNIRIATIIIAVTALSIIVLLVLLRGKMLLLVLLLFVVIGWGLMLWWG